MKDVRARFEAKVDKSGGPNSCWSWLGATVRDGRGQFWMDKKLHYAPRIAWSFHHGATLSDGLLACHYCDNPNCVNPLHIFIGTMSDNTLDAIKKGRHKGWQKQTACKRGHPFTLENTYITSQGYQSCHICRKMMRKA